MVVFWRNNYKRIHEWRMMMITWLWRRMVVVVVEDAVFGCGGGGGGG